MEGKEQSLKGLIWREDKPGRWLANGYMILEERGLPSTLEAALEERPVFSWKADNWLFRDMRSEPTLEAAKAAAQADYDQRIRDALEPSTSEGEPVIWMEFNNKDGFTGLRRWTRDPEQAARWKADPDAGRFEEYYATPQPTPVSPLPVGVRVKEAVRQYLDQRTAEHEDGHVDKGSYFSTLDNLPDFVAAALSSKPGEQ